MLPIPARNRWSMSRGLSLVRRAARSRPKCSASMASSRGSRPMWASSGTSPTSGDEQLAEGPGVDEAQLAAVVEGDDHVGVLLHRVADLGAQELAAHPQVGDQDVAVVEVHQQELALAPDPVDPPSLQAGDELLVAGVAAHRAQAGDDHLADPPAGELLLQVAADGLDLGKLRHGLRPEPRQRRGWRARRIRRRSVPCRHRRRRSARVRLRPARRRWARPGRPRRLRRPRRPGWWP